MLYFKFNAFSCFPKPKNELVDDDARSVRQKACLKRTGAALPTHTQMPFRNFDNCGDGCINRSAFRSDEGTHLSNGEAVTCTHQFSSSVDEGKPVLTEKCSLKCRGGGGAGERTS